MTHHARLALALFILALLPSFLSAAGRNSSRPELTMEATTQSGAGALAIRVFGDSGELKGSFGGAEVYINTSYMGYSPYTATSLAPGSYLIRIVASGYYDDEYWLKVDEKESYSLIFRLERKTGFLSALVMPSDATVLVDGREVSPGLARLTTGVHRVIVRRFAYDQKDFTVTIFEDSVTTLNVSLAESPFAIAALRVHRAAFDPNNAGVLGSTEISFRVTSYGQGRLEILDASGLAVASFDFPSFSTWEQAVTWNGKGASGSESAVPLPDGTYTVRLSARAAPRIGPDGSDVSSASAAPLKLESAVTLDSSLAISPYGVVGALPGLLFFPDPARVPSGTFAIDASAHAGSLLLAGKDGSGMVIGLGFGASLGDVGLALSGSVDTAKGATRAAASARVGLLEKDPKGLDFSLFMRASLASGLETDPFDPLAAATDAIDIEASLPLAFERGLLHVGIAPGALLALPIGGQAFEAAPLVRAGCWYADRSWRAGLSAVLAAESFSDPTPAWPLALALEFRKLIDATPLECSAALHCSISPSVDPAFGFDLGFGLLF